MNRPILCLLLFNSIISASQPIQWFEGSIVLKNNEVLTGRLSVELYYDVVLFKQDSLTSVFSAHQVASVLYHDPSANINRRFTSREYNESSSVYRLYEIVLSGSVQVLRKIKSDYKHRLDDASDYDYFMVFEESWCGIRDFYKIWPMLVNVTHGSIQQYAREYKLNLYQPADCIKLIKYFNELMRREPFRLVSS